MELVIGGPAAPQTLRCAWGLRPPDPPPSISSNMSTVGHGTYARTIAIVHACNIAMVHACTIAIVQACTIRLPHEMGLERRVTLYSLLWFPHIPPSERHSGCYHFDSNSDTLRPKSVLKTNSYSVPLLIDFGSDFQWFLTPKSRQNRCQIDISHKLGFEVDFCFQFPGSKCCREE